MSRVRWSETLAHDEASSSSSLVMSAGGTTPKARKSSLKPPSVGKPHKSKSAAKRRGRQKTIEIVDVAEAWRERGKIFRARLIMNDEKSGGDAFTLSNDCEIEKYYDVAERVLEQFLSTTVDDMAKLTEAYLVGNRLVKFVSRVLPTHKDYFANHSPLMELRVLSQSQLVELLHYLEELALIIDEDEYQAFARENQERHAVSLGGEAYEDSSSNEEEDVSDYEMNPYSGKRPAFLSNDDRSDDFSHLEEMTQESSRRLPQAQESKSLDRAFSDQLVLQIGTPPTKQQETEEEEKTNFNVEWSSPFPHEFHPQAIWREPSISLPVDFCDTTNSWPVRDDQQGPLWDRHDADIAREGPDSFLFAESVPAKMTLRPRALYGDKSTKSSSVPVHRDMSPKSVVESSEWIASSSADNKYENDEKDAATAPSAAAATPRSVEGYLQHLDAIEQSPPSDAGDYSEGDEEVASLTGSLKGEVSIVRRHSRHSRRHFKECVKCLL